MEGTPEDLDDEAEADEERPSSVLWTKCIQQSIFVDISDDDSLHFSDLKPGSFDICLNQDSPASEASVKIRENTQLASSDEEEEEATEAGVTPSGGSVTGSSSIRDSATHLSQTSGQTPVSLKGKQMWRYNEDPVNTSDEDQEDLPYDDDLANQGVLNYAWRKTSEKEERIMGNSKNTDKKTATGLNLRQTAMVVSQLPNSGVDAALVNDGGKEQSTDQRQPEEAVPTSNQPQHVGSTMISDLLLRHFTREDLLNATELIEAETLPEVSLMESLDTTVVSMVSQHIAYHGPSFFSHRNGGRDSSQRESEVKSGGASPVVSKREDEKSHSSQLALGSARDSESEGEHSPEVSHRSSSAQPANAEDSIQRCSLVRTRSFSELKYGQGQAS
ncbi:uncharacterized protein LOC116218485 [Clupea harengus]|uniref:Uncharacterized protein LOC116218485 n=1 Tax=Clupea harengus TaxID=7950 RepID=A0A6P8EJN7_CLUHA|nr:uncharacterized protein LOC116218485 [Clupea harengus]